MYFQQMIYIISPKSWSPSVGGFIAHKLKIFLILEGKKALNNFPLESGPAFHSQMYSYLYSKTCDRSY